MILRCATGNAGKLAEFRMAAQALGAAGIGILPLESLRQLPPCVEDGHTFEENAVKKALYYSAHCEDFLFADDSGLEVEALGGEPGVRSARYSAEGTDEANNRLLLERLRGVADRRARFVCVIALARQGRLIAAFRGGADPGGAAGRGRIRL